MKDQSGKNTSYNMFDPASGRAAMPVRPQKPKDGFGFGGGTFTPGRMPSGGYQAVWNFGPDPKDYKNSPVSKPDKGVV